MVGFGGGFFCLPFFFFEVERKSTLSAAIHCPLQLVARREVSPCLVDETCLCNSDPRCKSL